MTAIYEEARRCLAAKHMIYSPHEFKRIIAGLLEANDTGKCECEPIRCEDGRNEAPKDGKSE